MLGEDIGEVIFGDADMRWEPGEDVLREFAVYSGLDAMDDGVSRLWLLEGLDER